MPNTFKNFATANVGTTNTDVYTAGAGVQSTVIGMTVANTTNNNINVNVQATVNAQTVFLVKGALVPPGGAIVPVGGDQKVVLEAGDKLSVQSDTATSADVLLSVLEIS